MLGCVPGDPPYEDYIVTLSAEYAWNRDAPDWGWLHPVIVGGVTYYRSWFECDNRKFAWFQTPSVDEVLNSFAIPYVNGGTNIGGKFAKTVTLKSGQEVAAPINIVIGEAEIRIWTLSETNLPWETLSGKEQREAIIKVIKGRELAGCFGTSRSWVLPHSNDLHHGNFILEMYKRGISVINAVCCHSPCIYLRSVLF